MAFNYPADLKYLDSHEYVRLEGDVATIGITEYAVDQLGDIVFLELPETGKSLSKGDSMGSVESVKAVEDLVSPVTGTVVACNERLMESPEQLANDPYGESWLLKIQIQDVSELATMLSADTYRQQVEGV